MIGDVTEALRTLAPELWVAERPQRFLGVELGTRMTVVRLRDGGLWVHSPVAPDPGLRAAVHALGPVRFVVAPNRFHHLFVGAWAEAHPDAELHAAPGLPEKRRDLAFHALLGDAPPAGWKEDLDQVWVRGAPIANEVVFLHRASRTLIVADLAFHFGPEQPFATRLAARLLGAYGRLGPTRFERYLLFSDRAAARRAFDRIGAWDFERVVVAHGAIQERGGKEALLHSYAWL
jgi:hypothetical protein